ncbi:MAG: hypothetical protein GX442_22680 [Candidatus Riflebacteria bacterium]|nr:hypothetical protein [Candidatus Riflebacteria bacterium]
MSEESRQAILEKTTPEERAQMRKERQEEIRRGNLECEKAVREGRGLVFKKNPLVPLGLPEDRRR